MTDAAGQPMGNRWARRVVFDQNPPIATPVWHNEIDRDPPASSLTPVPFPSRSTHLDLTWSGEDLGSGVRDYAVLVSTDGSAFRPWIARTEALGATFAGEPGHSYAFVTIARDLAGNTEAMPSAPDAIGVIAPDAHSPLTFAVDGTDEDGWWWQVTTPDGEVVARSVTVHATRAEAHAAAATFRDEARWAGLTQQ